MLLILLSLLGWGLICRYAHNHPIKGVNFSERGGGGGDEAPAIPQMMTPEQQIASSPRLTEFDQMLRQYIGKSYGMPAEWTTATDVYSNLLNYIPQLTQLQEPAEYGQMAQGLQGLLDYTPERFAYPMADIQKALEAQQALQLEQYQKQIRPVLAGQGQLDSTYYANLLDQYLRGQQAQTYGTTADLLTQQALQNLQLSQWAPQFKSNILGQVGNLGQVRQGTQQYNVALQNALQEWIPYQRQNMAAALAGMGSQKLGLEQQNLMLPLSTYIPGLQNLYGMGTEESNRQYGAAMNAYNTALQEYEANKKGGLFGGLTGAAGGAALGLALAPFTGGSSLLLAGLGAGVGGAAGAMGPQGTGGSLFSSGLGGLGATYPKDLTGLTSTRYNPYQYDLYSSRIPTSDWRLSSRIPIWKD